MMKKKQEARKRGREEEREKMEVEKPVDERRKAPFDF